MTETFDPAAIAARLRVALERKGMSKRSVEQAAALSGGYLSRLTKEEGYGDTTVETLGRIARVLGVRMAWLAYGDGEMTASATADDADPYPNRRALKMSSDWEAASPLARAFVDGLRGGGGPHGSDMSIGDWLAELRVADARVRRGESLDTTPGAEEDVVTDPDDPR